MRNFFSINKKLLPSLATVFILVLLGISYLYVYIPNNERDLERQHFRWLQKIDENIRKKIEGSDTLLVHLLEKYRSKDSFENQEAINIISRFSKTSFVLGYDTQKIINDSVDKFPLKTREPYYYTKTDTLQKQFIISVTGRKNDSTACRILMTYKFEDFITPLLNKNIFDQYVVFYNGNYVYESFHSGMAYKNEDSLLQIKRGLTGATITSQKVGGVDYKMFLQPIYLTGKEKWIIAGLHSLEKYDKEKKELPAGITLLLIAAALGVLLFIPWIKIYFMGKNDRLKLMDVGRSVLVAKFLMALLVFFFFRYNYVFRNNENNIHSKQVIADKISAAFINQVDSANAVLNKLDSIMYKQGLFTDIKDIRDPLIQIKFADTTLNKEKDDFGITGKKNEPFKIRAEKDFRKSGTKYTDSTDYLKISDRWIKPELDSSFLKNAFIEINWLNYSGWVKYNWSPNKYNNIPASYNYRNYFKNVIKDKKIQPTKNSGKDLFYLDQLISRTSGQFSSIISKKSLVTNDTIKVVALSFKATCLNNAILPLGYSFAIVNESGDVLYHSDTSRNLNENIRDEFSNKEEYDDAINGRYAKTFKTSYFENDVSARIAPIKGFPYYIIVMNEEKYPANVDIETFSFTWGMILVFILMVMVDLLIVFFSGCRKTYFKKQAFVTSWLWPRNSSGNDYFLATIGHLLMIVSLLLIYHFEIFTYASYYFILILTIPLLTIFLNAIFLLKYRQLKNKIYFNYKVRGIKCSVLFLAALNLIAYNRLGNAPYIYIFFFQVLAALLAWPLIHYKRDIIQFINKTFRTTKNNYIFSYSCMVFTRLIITSAIPVVFFYSSSYNYEQNLLARYREFDFANQIKERFGNKIDSYKFDVLKKANQSAIYTDGNWIKQVQKIDSLHIDSSDITKENATTAAMIDLFGLYIIDLPANNNNFFKSNADDSSYLYNNFFTDVLYGDSTSGSAVFMPLNAEDSYLMVNSNQFKYSFPTLNTIKGWEFWLLLILASILFFLLMQRIIKKLFALNIPYLNNYKNLDTQMLQNIQRHKHLFVVGLPGSGKLKHILSVLTPQYKDFIYSNADASKINVYIVNFFDITVKEKHKSSDKAGTNVICALHLPATENNKKEDADWDKIKASVLNPQFKYIIINHFEYDVVNTEINFEKLNLLQQLMLHENKVVIILSEIDPVAFTNSIYANAQVEDKTKTNATITKWQQLLSDFPAVIIPLEKTGSSTNSICFGSIITKQERMDHFSFKFKWLHANLLPPYFKALVYEETEHARFLKQLKPDLLQSSWNFDQKNTFSGDIFSLKLQQTSTNYFTNIWHSLTNEEKFILFDLAEDGLVNTTDFFNINVLIAKGLIIQKDGNLHVFNKSFRNFIVTAIGEREFDKIYQQHKAGSNWNKLQGPLFIAIVTILIFLMVSQEGTYTKAIAIISGLATGIPTLLKLFSIFDKSSVKSSESNKA